MGEVGGVGSRAEAHSSEVFERTSGGTTVLELRRGVASGTARAWSQADALSSGPGIPWALDAAELGDALAALSLSRAGKNCVARRR